MYVFVSLPAPTQMSEKEFIMNIIKKQKLDYHANTGGSNGPEYSKQ